MQSSAACSIRTLDELAVVVEAPTALDAHLPECPTLVSIRARSRSFLHHQVRHLVATLLEAGRGRIGAQEISELLSSARPATPQGDGAEPGRGSPPKRAPAAVPAHGLYLAEVRYPAQAYVARPPGHIFRFGACGASDLEAEMPGGQDRAHA